MELILWRHTEAENTQPDIKRALTARGIKDARRMADWLNKRLPAQTHILVSPAKRAQQTAEALGRDFTTLDMIAPGATPEALLEAAGWPGTTDEPEMGAAVLIVGHQPTLGMAAALAITGKAQLWSVKKGAVWWISSRTRDEAKQAVLKLAISPDFL